MIADSIIKGFLATLLPSVKGIKHNQPGRAPGLPYYTFQEISNVSNGREQVTYSDVDDVYTESIDINKTEVLQVDFYTATVSQSRNRDIQEYKSAYQLAEEMTIRLNTFSSKAFQKQNNIGVTSWTDLTPFTKFMGDNNELRATIEIFINNNLNYSEQTYDIDIDTVNPTLEIEEI